ncbi:MAG: hypothetical protein KM310_06895 [Clostridiales bacterium]|nr:hypothetical protein [Clostridiales bacterium]
MDPLLTDPRSRDLTEDSDLWVILLSRCADLKLRISLHAFRAAGTIITWKNERWVMEPLVDPQRGWGSYEEYRRLRERFLVPKRPELIALLASLPKPWERRKATGS